jgi:putative protease
MTNKSTCELLLPVGNMKMCLAAIHNGADAIYVGMPEFNARGRSADHSLVELKEIIEMCHLYGVKVNLAFNVVIFETEILKVIKLLKEVLPMSPDAIIVQDLGLVKLIRSLSPDQIIHASTQMTVTNFEAMNLLQDLGIKRFVLGREVSIEEIKKIREKTDKELEVFVHGALCVAYSGQCFTSESIGGRSANRGQCAQSCRFEYEMYVDGTKKQLIDKKYLVSPYDLCGIAQIPSLIDLNVNSFKVEGRLKTPEYVAAAGKSYRMAIDAYYKKKELSSAQILDAKNEMGLTFSRGFFTGWLEGVDHQNLVGGEFSSHRGNLVGSVEKVTSKSVIIKSNHQFKKGDGVLFASIKVDQKIEVGGKIIEIKKNNHLIELYFHNKFEFKKVKKEFEVYFNSDVELGQKLSKSFEDKNLKKRIPLKIVIRAQKDKLLEVTVTDELMNQVNIYSDSIVLDAIDRPVKLKDFEAELGALGGSIYKIDFIELLGDENIYINQKELKLIRRKFVEKLNTMRVSKLAKTIFPFEIPIEKLRSSKKGIKKNLNILLRKHQQVLDLLSFSEELLDVLGIVYLDFEFGTDFLPSVKILKDKNLKVGIATTRILKPNEYHNFKIIERANPDVILIRNLGALEYFQTSHFELRGDFSLNMTNSLTKNYLLTKKLKSICASYDLNYERLSQLLLNSNPSEVEVTIHQYMPSFHMEHCVFAAFLSKGHTFRDCGKPCEKHTVELKDQFGNFHFIKADQECRNTMFNAQPQSAAKKMGDLKKFGLTEFRFEALDENLESLKKKCLAYAMLVRFDSIDNIELLFAQIGTMEKYGLGEGSLGFEKDFKNRKK